MKFLTAMIEPVIWKNGVRIGLSLFLFLLLSFSSSPQEMDKSSTAQMSADEQCVANLRHIYNLIQHYLHHSAKVLGFPANLTEIHALAEPNLFICPADKQINPRSKEDIFQSSYEIVNDPLKPSLSSTPTARIAILAEKRANHNGKRYVLFYDGSVRSFDRAQFQELKGNSFVANGPRSESPTDK